MIQLNPHDIGAPQQAPRETNFTSPYVQGWLGKIREAERHKTGFNDVAKQCMSFFSGAMNFMWESDFFSKHIGVPYSPKFKICIQKGFELVSLFGPSLYWRNPERTVKSREQSALDPELFAGDPEAEMLYQQLSQGSQQRKVSADIVSQLLEYYLNYTPSEQPGGLAWHSTEAITECLVKGRGCLWPKPYKPAGSDRVLTGSFYDSVDNLLIDPDATSLQDAQWIAQRVVQPIWQVEKEFGYAAGALSSYGSHESAMSQGERGGDEWASERKAGKTFDLLTYFKVYSKGGIGGRLSGLNDAQNRLGRSIDQVVGDHAYICVSPAVPFPLNAHPEQIPHASDDETRRRFQWPIPFWMDNRGRWPVAILDFYRKPNDPWAIAPLAPGLGELTFLNIMISSMCNRIHTASRTIIGASESLSPAVESAIKSGADLAYLKLGSHEMELEKLIKFIDTPNVSRDVWEIIDRVMNMFDRRTGLTELMSGMNPGGKVPRVASDVNARQQAASIRPEYMATKVEDWMSDVADMEKLCARWFVEPQHLTGFMGTAEQHLWGKYINSEHPEHIVRGFKATVMANSARRPDKNRDVENLQQAMQYFSQVIAQHGFQTGDMESFNELIRLWGRSVDQDVEGMMLEAPEQPEGQGQPDPQQEAIQQKMQIEQAQFQNKMEQSNQQHQQRMMQSQEQHSARMQQGMQSYEQKMLSAMTQSLAKNQMTAQSFIQDLGQDDISHKQDLQHTDEKHRLQIALARNSAIQNAKE